MIMVMGDDTGSDVLRQSRSDPERFAVLVDRHWVALYRYLAVRVGRDLAQDLAAETFLVAFRERDHYQAVHDSILPWLYGIATNLVRNHARSEQRRVIALGRLAAQAVADDAVEGVDEALVAASTLQEVAIAVGQLPPIERDVFALVVLESLSYSETAAALSIPIGTVRSRLARVRTQLRLTIDSNRTDQGHCDSAAVSEHNGSIRD